MSNFYCVLIPCLKSLLFFKACHNFIALRQYWLCLVKVSYHILYPVSKLRHLLVLHALNFQKQIEDILKSLSTSKHFHRPRIIRLRLTVR